MIFTLDPFGFPGQMYDVETGLHYNYHRYYDPRTGRYFTPDPIGQVGGDINIFLYASNNPVNLIDPNGLQATTLPGSTPGLPMVFPPVAFPGSPENRAFVKKVSKTFCQSKGQCREEAYPDYGWPGKGEKRWHLTKDNTIETIGIPEDPGKYECEPPPRDPCVFICMRAVEGKWYEKGWAWPLCLLCLMFGGLN